MITALTNTEKGDGGEREVKSDVMGELSDLVAALTHARLAPIEIDAFLENTGVTALDEICAVERTELAEALFHCGVKKLKASAVATKLQQLAMNKCEHVVR